MMKNTRKNAIRLSAAALAVAFCLASFAGCKDKEQPPEEEYTLNGRGISEYSIIIPADAGVCERYAAELLRDGIREVCGKRPEILTDESEETVCEILIGDTDRAESQQSAELGCDEYMVYSTGTKTVMMGDSYMVAGGIPTLLSALEGDGKISSDRKEYKWKSAGAESVILLIGDGMGKNHIELAETEDAVVVTPDGETNPQEVGGITFAAKSFENSGSMTTLNVFGEVTDSAASGTALATGKKTENGVLGMIPADLDGDGTEDELFSAQNVREAACLGGMKTAVISTDRMTGATPNAFLVHHADRNASSVILEQQKALDFTEVPVTFLSCGYDSDGFVRDIKSAISSCQGENGFFIMAEEAMIDKYASRLDFDNVIRTVKRLDEAVRVCATYAVCHPEVAVIVTADHETGGLTVGERGEFSWTSDGSHTETPVGIYAMGGGTEIFSGETDNTDVAKYIFEVIAK